MTVSEERPDRTCRSKNPSPDRARLRAADFGEPEADAEGASSRVGTVLQGDAGIDAEIDQVAIAGRAHHAGEDTTACGASGFGCRTVWSATT